MGTLVAIDGAATITTCAGVYLVRPTGAGIRLMTLIEGFSRRPSRTVRLATGACPAHAANRSTTGGDSSYLTTQHFMIPVYLITTGVVSLIVQVFLVLRAARMMKFRPLRCVIIAVLTMASLLSVRTRHLRTQYWTGLGLNLTLGTNSALSPSQLVLNWLYTPRTVSEQSF